MSTEISSISNNNGINTITTNKDVIQLLQNYKFFIPWFGNHSFMLRDGKIIELFVNKNTISTVGVGVEIMEIKSLCSADDIYNKIKDVKNDQQQHKILRDNENMLKPLKDLFACEKFKNVDLAICCDVIMCIDTAVNVSEYMFNLKSIISNVDLLTSVVRLNPTPIE